MANNFGKGIKVTSGFDLSAKAPLDNRTVVDTIAERNAHVTSNRAYEGLRVFVISERKEYLYNGLDWVEAGGLSDEEYSQLLTAYAHSLTEHASKEEIDEELDDMKKKINQLPTMELVNSKSDVGHNHDGEYYTMDQIDNKLTEIVAGGVIDLESYAKKSEVQIALAGKAEVSHSHTSTEIEGLDSLLESKADKDDIYDKEELTGKLNELTTSLGSKSDVGHNHDDVYYTQAQVDEAIADAMLEGEVNLNAYVTKTEFGSSLATKADIGHEHNDLYYTQTQVDEVIAKAMLEGEIDLSGYAKISDLVSKSDIGHGHTMSDIEGLNEEIEKKADKSTVALKTDLAGKSDLVHNHDITEINSLQATLDTKANIADVPSNQVFDARLEELSDAIESKADIGHDHNDVYARIEHSHNADEIEGLLDDVYTKTEMNGFLSTKADTGHDHDGFYYTKNEVDEAISKVATDGQVSLEGYATKIELTQGLETRAMLGHNHTPSDIEGLEDLFGDTYSKNEIDTAIISAKTEAMAYADSAIADLVDSAPEALDTLNELASEINKNHTIYETYVATMAGQLSGKADVEHIHNDIYYTKEQVQELVQTGIDGVDLSNLALKSELQEGLVSKSDIGHMHEIFEVNNLQLELNKKIDSDVAATKADISGIQTQLSSKSDIGHDHNNEYYTKEIVDQKIQAGVDGVDLSNLATKTELEQGLNSKAELTHGHEGVYADANHDHEGLYLTEPEIDGKLENTKGEAILEAVTEANAYTEGRVLDILGDSPGSLGDLNKTLNEHVNDFNTYKQEVTNSLATKSDIGHNHDSVYSELYHNHAVADITDINAFYFTKEEVSNSLATKSDLGHLHHDVYYTKEQVDERIQTGVDGIDLSIFSTKQELTQGLAGKSDLGHTHDYADSVHQHKAEDITDLFDKVYKKAEVDSSLAKKAEIDHLHNGVYSEVGHSHNLGDLNGLTDEFYTKSEIDGALATKSDISHSHTVEMIYGLTEALNLKADKATTATKEELTQGLSGKAELNHLHDDRYAMKVHDHTGLYLTEEEINDIVEEECGLAIIQATTQANTYTDGKILEILGGEDGGENTLSGLAKSIEEHKAEFETYKTNISTELSGKSDLGHGHEISEIQNLQKTLDTKANKADVESANESLIEEIEKARILAETNSQVYTDSAVAGLVDGAPAALNTLNELAQAIQEHQSVYEAYVANIANALAGKSDLGHDHNGLYYTKLQVDDIIDTKIGDIDFSEFALRSELATKADVNHNHNDAYSALGHKHTTSDITNLYDNIYSKIAVDGLVGAKADVNHNHNDSYYTKTEVDDNIMAKLDEIDLSEYVTNEALAETLRTKADYTHYHDDAYYRKWQIDAKFSGMGLSGYATLEDLTNWSTQFALKNHTHDGMSASVEDSLVEALLLDIYGFVSGKDN